jgi:diguanylate cyclase (GGDEF)-like protein
MKANKQLLVLADADRAGELTDRLAGRNLEPATFTDAFSALETLSEGSWSTVLVSTRRGDFAGLCEAIRQLQPTARILAICQAVDEPEVRDLLGLSIDEYFIHPASDRDIETISHWVGPAEPSEGDVCLSADIVADLIASTRSLPALQQFLAERTAEIVGSKISFVDALPPGVQPILTLEGRQTLYMLAEADAVIDEQAKTFLRAIRRILPSVIAAVQRTETLHRLAITDHLTGAYNRRYFYHATDRILREAEGKGANVTLLLFDIDDFKRYNDTYGHATGDLILQEIAEMMGKITRSQDIVARIGGDEFAVLFWDEDPPRKPDSSPPESVQDLAKRFCRGITQHDFRSLGRQGTGRLTISGGLATFPVHGRTCTELLSRADEALHEVKRTGKNAICLVGHNGQYVTDGQTDQTRRAQPKPPGQA